MCREWQTQGTIYLYYTTVFRFLSSEFWEVGQIANLPCGGARGIMRSRNTRIPDSLRIRACAKSLERGVGVGANLVFALVFAHVLIAGNRAITRIAPTALPCGGAALAVQSKIPEKQIQDWLRLVAEAYAADGTERTSGGVTARRAFGGVNNAMYQIETGGQRYACKLCVADERKRAAREYGVLRLLQAAGLDIAPEPVWLDETCAIVPFPTVIYRWLPGEPLKGKLNAIRLAALGETFGSIHSLGPGDFPGFDLPDAWFHWFDFAPYLAELREFLNTYGSWLAAALPDGGGLRDRLARLVDSCAETLLAARVKVSRDNVPLRLCRVDPSLGNAIWCEDDRLRWIDWEYCGWGDPALDLADLRWHAALTTLGEARHAWLRMNYRRPPDDPAFDERLALWDHLLATRWPFLILRWMWNLHNGPDRMRLSQMEADPAELRARLVRFIERAEQLR